MNGRKKKKKVENGVGGNERERIKEKTVKDMKKWEKENGKRSEEKKKMKNQSEGGYKGKRGQQRN